jgi:hypothetical protein
MKTVPPPTVKQPEKEDVEKHETYGSTKRKVRRTVPIEVRLGTGIETAPPTDCGQADVRCYEPNELERKPTELFVGEKGWTRRVYRVRNTGTESIPRVISSRVSRERLCAHT